MSTKIGISILLLLQTACVDEKTNTSAKLNVKFTHSITLRESKNLTLHIQKNLKYTNKNHREYIYFYNENTQELLRWNMLENKPPTKQSTLSIFHTDIPESFAPASLDSIYFLSRSGDKITLLDSAGNQRKTWNKITSLQDGSLDYFYSTGFEGLQASQRYLLMQQSLNRPDVFENRNSRKKYYQNNFGIVFDAQTEKFYNTVGIIPSYINADNTWYTFFGQTAITRDGRFLFSYPYSEEVWIYDVDGQYKKNNISSDSYLEPRPYPNDSLTDSNFAAWYNSTQYMFTGLIADPYRKINYRILRQPLKISMHDGIRKVTAPKYWTLIAFNNDLHKLGEIRFSSKLDHNIIIPTKEGLTIKRKAHEKSDWTFSVYKINLNK